MMNSRLFLWSRPKKHDSKRQQMRTEDKTINMTRQERSRKDKTQAEKTRPKKTRHDPRRQDKTQDKTRPKTSQDKYEHNNSIQEKIGQRLRPIATSKSKIRNIEKAAPPSLHALPLHF
jgi:hypothetical protein